MPIFARRVLQRMLYENDKFLSQAQTKKHVDFINKADEKSLAYEWEVVVLNVLSKIGCVSHEDKFGSVRPDIYFELTPNSTDAFLCDITTVSDEGQINEKFKTTFTKLLRQSLGAFNLEISNFSFEIRTLKVDDLPSRFF